jgi:hypothetical protein
MKPMHKYWRQLLLISLLAALLLGAALAGERIDRSVLSAGGRVTNSNVALHSAIAQPVAGVVVNPAAHLVLCSGYVCGRTAGTWLYLPLVHH